MFCWAKNGFPGQTSPWPNLQGEKERHCGNLSVVSILPQEQSAKSRLCKCGAEPDKAKPSEKLKAWISHYLSGGKQHRELIGNSTEEARDPEGKRRSRKRKTRIFDIKPDTKMGKAGVPEPVIIEITGCVTREMFDK